MTRPFIIFLGCCISIHARTQTTDTSTYRGSLQKAVSIQSANNPVAGNLYNGIEHLPYPNNYIGLPYLLQNDWLTGTVEYNNITYNQVSLKYDLLKDELIVLHPSGNAVRLLTARVHSFSLPGYFFINNKDANTPIPGFVEQKVKGEASVFIKHKKQVKESVTPEGVVSRIQDADNIYVLNKGTYHQVRTRNHLEAALKDHREEVNQFIRRSDLNFRINPIETVVQVAQHYNQIKRENAGK